MGIRQSAARETVPSAECYDEDGPTAAKRARLDPAPQRASLNTNSSSNVGKEGSTTYCLQASPSSSSHPANLPTTKATACPPDPQPPRWEELPYVALVEIFQGLSNGDKLCAGLVCRSWQSAFSRPALWRRGNFRFNGVDDWRALCFASMMGAALRHVTIDCSVHNSINTTRLRLRQAKQSAENLSIFLTALVNSGNCQVSSFRLRELRCVVTHGEDILPLLCQFLGAQDRLTLLHLDWARLTADFAFQLLMIVADKGEHSIRSLSICEIISSLRGYEVASDPRLHTLLSRFKTITDLSLSQHYLSDDLLYLLSATLASTLTQLSVLAACQFGRTHKQTTSQAWRYLKLRCPALKASYTIKDVSDDLMFREVLTPQTPLTCLHWNSGILTTTVRTQVCFQHIVTHFARCLCHLELDLHHSFLDEEEDLPNIIHNCLCLETLSLSSDLLLQPQRRLRVGRAVRKAFARQPRSQLRLVRVNEQELSLKETWATAIVGWLLERVQ